MADNYTRSTFMYDFNQQLAERERIFKLHSVVVNNEELTITFIVNSEKYDSLLDNDLKEKVYNVTQSIVPASYNLTIKYKKTVTEHDYIVSCVTKYVYDTSPMLYGKLNPDCITTEINYASVNVYIDVSPMIFSYMRENEIDVALEKMLNREIIEGVTVTLVKNIKINDNVVYKRKAVQRNNSSENEIRTITIATKNEVIGMIARMPRYISDVNHSESQAETICGKVSEFSVKESKKNGKLYYTFTIDDSTAKMNVLYFPFNEKQGKRVADMVTDGEQVVIEGQVVADSRGGGFKFFMKRLSLADIDYSTIQTGITYLTENEEYINIVPKKYVDLEQGSFVDDNGGFGLERKLPESLKGDFVIFDLETTGLSQSACKIIEIGAVKMRDGAIIETFSTLINPGEHIPDDATAVNNITDDMVKECPSFADVVGDFYKFTRGATLVAHNAPFDVGFIAYHAKQCSYNFDNDVIDTLQMANNLYGNKKNNLGSLCKRLNVDLEGAHRAVNDATATAIVFRKMKFEEEERR